MSGGPPVYLSPNTSPPSTHKPCPSPAHLEWSGPCSVTAPPTSCGPAHIRTLLWAPSTKQVPAADASHSARPFLGSTPNSLFAVHFRSHPPSIGLAQDPSLFKVHLRPLPRRPHLTQTSLRPRGSVLGRPQAHPSQPQPFSCSQISTTVTPAGGAAASSVAWHSLRYRSQRWYSSPAVCPSEPAYKKRKGGPPQTRPALTPAPRQRGS